MSRTQKTQITYTLPQGELRLTSEYTSAYKNPSMTCTLELAGTSAMLTSSQIEELARDLKDIHSGNKFQIKTTANSIILSSTELWPEQAEKARIHAHNGALEASHYTLHEVGIALLQNAQEALTERLYSPLAKNEDGTTTPLNASIRLRGSNVVSITFSGKAQNKMQAFETSNIPNEMQLEGFRDSSNPKLLPLASPLAQQLETMILKNVEHGHSAVKEITKQLDTGSFTLTITAPNAKSARTLYTDLNNALQEMEHPTQNKTSHTQKLSADTQFKIATLIQGIAPEMPEDQRKALRIGLENILNPDSPSPPPRK